MLVMGAEDGETAWKSLSNGEWCSCNSDIVGEAFGIVGLRICNSNSFNSEDESS